MNICIFDTETVSLDKPYCYNIGFTIYNVENEEILLKADYVVEQVWHNLALFNTAYYADKREIYVGYMRSRKATLDKFGYICQRMIRLFSEYNVEFAYAYNSAFDERVFNFNCDWFKCANPFDNVPIYDIRGYAIDKLVNAEYKAFCEENEYYTESGNYSTTAEVMTRYITKNTDFVEEHTALSDSLIETEILKKCIALGSNITEDKKAPKSIEKREERTFRVTKNGKELLSVPCFGAVFYKSKMEVRLKS